MITYNHEIFVSEAIEGVLKQKTNFPFELIISDDCSLDSTRLICEHYARENTNIRLIFSEMNLGYRVNFLNTLNECHSDYVAICEGDDYWVDQYKLQKQFDIMEKNNTIKICFHATDVLNENGELFQQCYKYSTAFTNINEVIRNWYIHTCSMFFRNPIEEYPVWFKEVFNTDYALQLILLKDGGFVYYIHDTMAVYRKHTNGVSNTVWGDKPWFWLLHLFYKFDIYSNKIYNLEVQQRIDEIVKTLSNYYYSCAIQSSPIKTKLRIVFFIRFILLKLKIVNFFYKKFLNQVE